MGVTNEPPSITDGGENPDSWSHWDIYNAFNPLNTTNGHTCSQNYSQLASGWESAVTFFNARIKQSSDAAWQGAAAEASRTAISNYVTRALDLCDSLNAMSTQVSAAIDGVNGTKNGTDKPIEHVGHWSFGDGDFLWHHGNRSLSKINEERDKAREAMKSHYVSNFVAADGKIPQAPKPEGIGNSLYTFTSGNNPTSGISNSGHGGGNGISGSGSGAGSGGDNGSGGQSTGTSGASSSLSSYQSSHASSSLSTTPSSYYSGISASTLPSSFTGGTGTGTGSGGFDGGGTGGTTSGGGLGKSVPGTTGTTTGAAAAAAATRAGASTPGMAGMGGMGGANKGGKDDEDRSHAIPEWLRTMENTEELLGAQEKTIPGGVIGGDYDQNHRT